MSPKSFPTAWQLLVLAVLSGPTAGAAAAPGLVLPSEICRGLWIVPLSFGEAEEKTLQLVLDTGAEPTSADPEALSRILGRPVEPGKVYTLREGRIGHFPIDKIRIGAFDLDDLDRVLGRKVDGILGFPTFRRVLLTLDYESEEVRVREGRLPLPDDRGIFRDVGGTRPMLSVDVAGKKEKILIDSGSTGEFDLVPHERLDWIVEPRPVAAAVRFSRTELDEAGRMAGSLALGPALFEEPIVERTDRISLAGYKVMRHFIWTFDKRSNRIGIRQVTAGPIRLEAVRGWGVALEPRDHGFEVIRVFPGTAGAAAGLERGDLVTHQDGVPIFDRDCVSPGDDPDRGSFRLTIRRGADTREVDVSVGTLVP